MPSLPRHRVLILVLTLSGSFAALAPAATEKLSLDDAIHRSLVANYSIRSDSFSVAIARARVLEQFGIFDPQFSATYSNSENENPQLRDLATGVRPPATETLTDTYDLGLNGLLPWGLTYTLGATSTNTRGTFNAFADTYDTFAGISGRQPLFRDFGFGPTTTRLRIAQTDRSISEWQFKQSIIDTITRVIFAYHDLDFAHATLRSARSARQLAAQLLDENEKRFRVGAMSQFDVTTARSRLANREEGILASERLVRESENFMKLLISGERTPRLLDWHLEIEPTHALPVAVADVALDFPIALRQRPDYQQALLTVRRADINRRFQRNQLLPRVDLVGSLGYAGRDTDADVARRAVRQRDNRAYSYGLQVTVPLTFTTERGRYRAAKFQHLQAETGLAQIEQGIVVTLGNAAANLETTRLRVAAARAALDLGQQTLDAELKRLRAGTGTTFFVLQQQEIVTGLEVSDSRARSDYLKALAEYDRQLGATLEKYNLNVDIPR